MFHNKWPYCDPYAVLSPYATSISYRVWQLLSIIFILSVKRSHHVRREGLEITTLIQKREEYTLLDFMKIW
jgi:hypothetical protein